MQVIGTLEYRRHGPLAEHSDDRLDSPGIHRYLLLWVRSGGKRAPTRFIDWQTFFDFGDGNVRPNKKIDTRLSTVLFDFLALCRGTCKRLLSATCCVTSPLACQSARASPKR